MVRRSWLLTGWLVEYNFNRSHQSLGYATPIEFLTEKLDEKVLPMCPIRAVIGGGG